MSDLSIRTFTIRHLVASRAQLESLEDPQGHLSACNDAWIRLLASNPSSTPDDIALILAVDAGSVVGRLGLYAGVLQRGPERERVFYGAGFALDPAYRATGAGGMIFLTALSGGAAFLASGDPDEACQRLYRAARASNLGPLRCFLYFYDAAIVLRRITPSPWLPLFASLPLTRALRIFYSIRGTFAGPSAPLRFAQVDSFSRDIDALLDNDQRCLLRRDANTLNWVLAHREAKAYEVWSGGKLAGYCILAEAVRAISSPARQSNAAAGDVTMVKFGYLIDYYLSDQSESTAASLIRFCLEQFRGKVDVFECQCIDSNLEAACRMLGLHERTGMKQFLKPRRGAARDPERDWFLTLGAGDVILWY